MSENLLRAFVAVRPTPDRRSRIAATVRQRVANDARLRRDLRLVKADRLHLTLAFLGALPLAREADLLDAARRAAATHERFDLGFAGLGGFPTSARARVAWLGVREGRDPLISLAAVLRARLDEQGLPFDAKPFRPHLTVARSRRGPVALPTSVEVRIPPCPINEVEVVRSVVGPNGAEHRTLARWPFPAAAAL